MSTEPVLEPRHSVRPLADPEGLVIAIFGPTAVGKTEIASRVAGELGVRVISCDSMQIYRGFPVLTNQPRDPDGTKGPAHALVGVADADEEWSAARYAHEAQSLMDEDLARTGWAVIAGGTGLYLRAALAPLQMADVVDPSVRERLERLAAESGPHALHDRLASLDPEAAERIHPHNVRRVVRALEVLESTAGSSWSGRDDLWQPEYRRPTLLVVLTADRALLAERVERRAREMMAGGAVDEVRTLLEARGHGQAVGPVRGVRRAIGFQEIAAHLRGEATLDETVAALAAATRRYVRRQTTWMRKLSAAVIIDAPERGVEESAEEVVLAARAAWGRGTVSERGAEAHPARPSDSPMRESEEED